VQEEDKKWHKDLDLLEKERLLSKFNPLSQAQFKQLTQEENPQTNLANLLKDAIERNNLALVKLVLNSRIRVNEGVKVANTQINFLTLIDNLLAEKNSEELEKIKTSLVKHGCKAAEKEQVIEQRKDLRLHEIERRKLEHEEILKKVAKDNSVNADLYKTFDHLLKANLDTAISGIKAAASGNLVVSQKFADKVIGSILGKIPAVGDALATIYSGFRGACNSANLEQLASYFSNSAFRDYVVEDYCIRVIRHYGEEIANPPSKSFVNKVKVAIEGILKKVAVDNILRHKFNGKDYTADWNILVAQHTAKFLEYLTTENVIQNFADPSFGIEAAKYLFEFHKVTNEDISSIKLTDKFDENNPKIFAKLISYTSEIARYPRSLAMNKDTYWCDTTIQDKKINIDAKSLITADKNKIIVAYNSSHDIDRDLKSKTKKLAGIEISSRLHEDFFQFFDRALYHSTENNSVKSLGLILQDSCKKYPEAKIYLIGDRFGGVIACLTQLMLIDKYKIGPKQLIIYTYGEQAWCHKNSVPKAKDLFQHYYQIVVNEENSVEHQDYHFAGEKFYLKAGHLLSGGDFKKALQSQIETKNKTNTIKGYVEDLERVSEILSGIQLQATSSFRIVKKMEISEIYQDPCLIERINIASNESKLFQAIKEDDIKKLKELLFYEDINQEIESIVPLHAAVYIGNYEVVKYLVDNGADISIRDKCSKYDHYHGHDLLRIAIQGGQLEIVQYLIEDKNMNVNEIGLMNSAARYGQLNIIKYLIKNGGDVNARYEWNFEFPIHAAASSGNLKLVQYLIEEQGVDVNTIGDQGSNFLSIGERPLHKAVLSGNTDLVKYLVKKGADINALALHLDTPLSYAASYCDFDMIKYLVECGANINITGLKEGLIKAFDYNSSPLHNAVERGRLDIVKFLVEKGANINSKDHQFKWTALHDAIPHFAILKFLVEKGADINSEAQNDDMFGRKEIPLHHAYDNLRVFKYLVEHGADINAHNKQKQTPLDYLLQKKDQPNVLQYLALFRLQNRLPNEPLTFDSYKETFEDVLSKGCNWYSLSTYFVSECIRMNNAFEENLGKTSLRGKEKSKILEEQKEFQKTQKQFFEGGDKIQVYNQAIKLLFTYSNPQKFSEALKICDKFLNIFPEDQSFLFLKGICYINQVNLNSNISSNKAEYFYTKTVDILSQLEESTESFYLAGELSYTQGDYEEAGTYYEEASRLDPYFNHPKARILEILVKQGRQKEAEKINNQLEKEILPIDLEIIMQNLHEAIETKDFMDTQAAKTLAQHNFDAALKEIFVVDAKDIQIKLQKNIPNKLVKQDLKSTGSKKESFNASDTLDKIDYGYELLAKFFGGKIFGQKDFAPENKTYPFFEKINTLVSRLTDIKTVVVDQCDSVRDFKNDQIKTKYINLIDDLITYYNSYIMRVIKDYQYSQDPNYLKRFNSGKGKLLDVEKNITVYTERKLREYEEGGNNIIREINRPYLLKKAVSHELTIAEPKSEQRYGTHKIVVLPEEGDNQVYYKYYPYAPGIEYAVSSLYGLILPKITPETILVKLIDDKAHKAIYLASKGVPGRNFAEVIDQPEVVRTLDMKNFSGLFISSFLVCTGDAKPDNYVMHFNYGVRGLESTELISVDNDIAFCRQKLNINANDKKLYADMLNILYLMPQMDQPVSPFLREYLKREENQPEIMVARWLNSLYQKNQNYQTMLGFDKEDLEKLKLPIKLPKGAAAKVYSTLTKVANLLKVETVTHNDIFQALSPSLAYFYEKSRDATSVVNSLKNLYVAAGADPNIVTSLYNTNKIVSSKAWNTMSASKRKNDVTFKNMFNSTISEEAEGFISSINFAKKNDQVVLAIKDNLNFVENLTIHNIDERQYNYLMNGNSFPKMKNIKLLKTEFSNSIKEPISKQPKLLEIDSIWKILKFEDLPNSYDLINTIKKNKLDINEKDENGDTVLYEIVRMACKKNADDRYIGRLIKILLDCGLNTNLLNKKGQSVLDIAEKVPDIIISIFDHQPLFLQNLIKMGLIEEAEIIARSMNSQTFAEILDGDLIGNESSILREVLSNRALKLITLVTLNKLERLTDPELLHLFATNYTDEDIDVLKLLLNLDPKLVTYTNNLGRFAADIAYERKQHTMLAMIFNEKGKISKTDNENINLIAKAAYYGIKIDSNEFGGQFDIRKTDKDNNTVLHLLIKNSDKEVLTYAKEISKYKDILNKEGKTISHLAEYKDFVEVLEILYADKDMYIDRYDGGGNNKVIEFGHHRLAKNDKIKELSRLLHKYDFNINIAESRLGIDLYNKVDKNGNTLLQKLVKNYSLSENEEIWQEIDTLVKYADDSYLNYTFRSDGNTALHLAVIANDSDLVGYLVEKPTDFAIRNSQGQTVLDLANELYDEFNEVRKKIVNHKNTKKYDHNLKTIERLFASNFSDVGKDLSTEDRNLPSIMITLEEFITKDIVAEPKPSVQNTNAYRESFKPSIKTNINTYNFDSNSESQNAYSSKDNSSYWYDSIDMHYISHQIVKDFDKSKLNTSIKALDKGNLGILKSEDLSKPIVFVYNINDNHWITLCLCKDSLSEKWLLCKDSLGKDYSKDSLIHAVTKNLNLNEPKLIINNKQEQIDGSSCGIFALENMRIMAKSIESQSINSFIEGFELKNDFSTQPTANYLRTGEFAKKYLEGYKENKQTDIIDIEQKTAIRRHHQPELQRLKHLLKQNLKMHDAQIEITNAVEYNKQPNSDTPIILEIGLTANSNTNIYEHMYILYLHSSVVAKIKEIAKILKISDSDYECHANLIKVKASKIEDLLMPKESKMRIAQLSLD
jgi:ankyrin repeat protein